VACLNIKSSVSDSQPHYSVVSLYHKFFYSATL
jgi:hypothetical protein